MGGILHYKKITFFCRIFCRLFRISPHLLTPPPRADITWCTIPLPPWPSMATVQSTCILGAPCFRPRFWAHCACPSVVTYASLSLSWFHLWLSSSTFAPPTGPNHRAHHFSPSHLHTTPFLHPRHYQWHFLSHTCHVFVILVHLPRLLSLDCYTLACHLLCPRP